MQFNSLNLKGLTRENLLLEIGELKKQQDILSQTTVRFYNPELLDEYRSCRGDFKLTNPTDFEKGKYYFIEKVFDVEDITREISPSLFLCAGVGITSIYDGLGLFGGKKKHIGKDIKFVPVWSTCKNYMIQHNKNSLYDPSYFANHSLTNDNIEKEYHVIFDPKKERKGNNFNGYSIFSAKKAEAYIFYKKYLDNAKTEFTRIDEEYKKFIYVSLRLKALEEELSSRDIKKAISSININESEYAALQKKYNFTKRKN